MTETVVLGIVTALGALVARYAQTHPFYKYKTQKLKDHYVGKAMHAFHSRQSHHKNDIYFYSRAITDYVFDFNKRLYHDYHVERFMHQVHSEKSALYKFQIETPDLLCEQLVRRAAELKVPMTLFTHHMRELWILYLIPVGKLTPKSIYRVPGGQSYVMSLENLPTPKEQVNKYMRAHMEE